MRTKRKRLTDQELSDLFLKVVDAIHQIDQAKEPIAMTVIYKKLNYTAKYQNFVYDLSRLSRSQQEDIRNLVKKVQEKHGSPTGQVA